MLTDMSDAEIAARRGVGDHRSPFCWTLPEGCTCRLRLTKAQVDARWAAWIAEVPARAALFGGDSKEDPVIIEDSD